MNSPGGNFVRSPLATDKFYGKARQLHARARARARAPLGLCTDFGARSAPPIPRGRPRRRHRQRAGHRTHTHAHTCPHIAPASIEKSLHSLKCRLGKNESFLLFSLLCTVHRWQKCCIITLCQAGAEPDCAPLCTVVHRCAPLCTVSAESQLNPLFYNGKMGSVHRQISIYRRLPCLIPYFTMGK